MMKLKVLVISPSVNINDTLGGIPKLTRIWLKNNKEVDYKLFEAGSKTKKSNPIIQWIKQPYVLLSFVFSLIFKKVHIVHVNMPLAPFAILRDASFVFISYLFRKKVVLHLRGGGYNLNKEIPSLYLYLLRQAVKLSNRTIVLGEKEKTFWINHYSFSVSKLIVIPNCVEIQDKIESKILPSEYINLLYIARVDRNKGLVEIADALIKFKGQKIKLYVAGVGPDLEWFKNICKQRDLENIEFLGLVSGERKHKIFELCNVFILPSYFEGLPNSLLEAMSYGLVPIVTPVGSIPNVVKDGVNGLLIQVKNIDDIVNALLSLKSNDRLFYDMSINAYETMKTEFSIPLHLSKINSLYIDLITNNNE